MCERYWVAGSLKPKLGIRAEREPANMQQHFAPSGVRWRMQRSGSLILCPPKLTARSTDQRPCRVLQSAQYNKNACAGGVNSRVNP